MRLAASRCQYRRFLIQSARETRHHPSGRTPAGNTQTPEGASAVKHVIALLLALTLNASANLMLKVGARRFGEGDLSLDRGLVPLATAVLGNWVLILGLCCFAVNVLFYTYALSADFMKVSMAYPIMVSGGFVIIAVVAWRYLGETMSAAQWVGVGLILFGVVLVAQGMDSVKATG
jgi:multidrug transporter EmrE-like cation transporter